MKKLVILLVFSLLMIGWLSAFVTPFVKINNENQVLFSDQTGFQMENNRLWITYIERTANMHYVKLGVSNNYGLSYTTTIIDTLYDNYTYMPAPGLIANTDGSCNVFYVKETNIYSFDLVNAKILNGNIVSKTTIANGLKYLPQISKAGNNIFLTYKKYLLEQLSVYEYFSQVEKSNLSNNDPLIDPAARVRFWGKDEFHGKVHSNSDIWIQNAGTPAVNPFAPGWPLFNNMVTTTGHFKENSSGTNLVGSEAPIDQIFQGPGLGYIEEADTMKILDWHGKLDAMAPFGWNSLANQYRIFKLTLNGNSISVQILDFSQTHIDTVVVYSHYPDIMHQVVYGDSSTYIGDSLYTNYVTVRDTVWTNMGGLSTGNGSMYIPGTVWIEGCLAGKFTLYCENAYITGNITYAGIAVGSAPDVEANPNNYDCFGLVANGSIYIKYKYRKKNENGVYETFANTASGPGGHVYIYGALAALGKGDNSEFGYKNDGVFSYEYQHPHGAVTPYHGVSQYTGQDTLYTNIDLHRHQFPPTGSANDPLWMRWPITNGVTQGFPGSNNIYGDYTQSTTLPLYGTSDWPWYNPVWPEKDGGENPADPINSITWERGTIHHYGSIAQTRHGLLHRSGNAGISNPDVGTWDYPNIFGPAHYIDGYGSTGYDKDFHYDSRLQNNILASFPSVLYDYDFVNTLFNPSNNLSTSSTFSLNKKIKSIKSASYNNHLVFAYVDEFLTVKYSLNNGESYDSLSCDLIDEVYDIKQMGDVFYFLVRSNSVLMTLSLDLNNPIYILHNYEANIPINIEEPIKPQLIATNSGLLIFRRFNNANQIYKVNFDSPSVLLETFELNDYNSISFSLGNTDSLYIVARKDVDTAYHKYSDIYLAKAYLNGITPISDPVEIPVQAFSMNCYPNPFNPEVNIDFYLPKDEKIEVSIYNIKGQRVKNLYKGNLEKGNHHYLFKGKDQSNKALASGIYFVKVAGNQTSHLHKIIMLK